MAGEVAVVCRVVDLQVRRMTILAADEQHLEDLPPHGGELEELLANVVVDISSVHHRVELESSPRRSAGVAEAEQVRILERGTRRRRPSRGDIGRVLKRVDADAEDVEDARRAL